MLPASFLETVRDWRARRKLLGYLRAHAGACAVVEFRGCHFYAGLDNKIEASLLRGERAYDHANFTAAVHFVRPGHVCLDVGANIGVYSNVLARLSGSGEQVHAFEPVDHVRAKLLENARLNAHSTMHVNSFALGANAGALEMYQVKSGLFRGGTSTFVRNENVDAMGEEAFEKRVVEVRTLDAYVQNAALPRVDFIKIDVEGFELFVLQGAGQTLERFRPVVLIEYDQTRHGRQGHGEALHSLLASRGYRSFEFASAGDELVLFPFDFSGQPRNRNVLCVSHDR